MLAFLIKACVTALRQFPEFNASLDKSGENLIVKKYFHIGVAVDTPGGLVVPVVRDADRKGVFDLARELAEISKLARDGKLKPGDMQGGTFSISSLGGIGGTAFTPIINAPEVAILGVSTFGDETGLFGKNEKGEDVFRPRLILPLSLSYDHRVIDGAAAARFTTYLAPCSPTSAGRCSRWQHRRRQGPRHRRLQGRRGHRSPGQARRHGGEGTVADHARVGQGDDGDSVARGRRGEGNGVKVGDKVSQGSVILKSNPEKNKTPGRKAERQPRPARRPPQPGPERIRTSTATCWCWAPGRAATRRRSAPPTSA